MPTFRPPAVAGMFYPDDPVELRTQIQAYLAAATPANVVVPKALIVPHAGYRYSGPVAASAYVRLAPIAARIERVILLGPAHRVALRGIAASSADLFRTPLGDVPLDRAAIDALIDLPQVGVVDQAHAQEHSLEVHLPFLQALLGVFKLVPLVVGEAAPAQVAEVIERLWGGPETLIVISSDLSHYHDYATAQRMDKATSEAILSGRIDDIGYHDACGRNPVNGLLAAVSAHGLTAEMVDLRNSGDTAGPRDKVVGYGAYVFH
ncbi:MAG: AmmeMemoRadiSam system protein B [Gammaproteobacteria bacterium]|nr:AmmeMemoRadiSam system protein B [Gammaproteobacteria bacterium]MCP5135850.1 AmmeMemoRadiSam system protein B [Gammaproteobacteria bacterium]